MYAHRIGKFNHRGCEHSQTGKLIRAIVDAEPPDGRSKKGESTQFVVIRNKGST